MTEEPGWLAKLIFQVGVPAAIAIFLVWFLALRLDARIDAIAEAARASSDTMKAASTSMSVFSHEQTEIHIKSLQLMRQVCVNTSKTAQQVELCR